MGYYDNYWPPYVSVAERKKKAEKHVASLNKKGISLNPIVITGRKITTTFWGNAWCENLEAYSDLANRLPRGRSYVRNGSVIDLQVTKGQIKAQVMGSSLYKVTIDVTSMPDSQWKTIVKACTGQIDSLIELLQGKFSKAVMEIITQKKEGLFPKPQEMKMKCSCPDYADMCKHIAAVLYGIGAALDAKPELLFTLRHVDHLDLITTASGSTILLENQKGENLIEENELSALFGIEMDSSKNVIEVESPKVKKTRANSTKKSSHNSQKPVVKTSKTSNRTQSQIKTKEVKPKAMAKAIKKTMTPTKMKQSIIKKRQQSQKEK